MQAWDTAVAINRTNPKNIVVSWGLLNHAVSPVIALSYRAVSFDGGKTWPFNGLMNVPPTGNPATVGDNRGVSSDKFGNIWYSATNLFDNLGNLINQPYFAVSTDGGVTFTLAFTVPARAVVWIMITHNIVLVVMDLETMVYGSKLLFFCLMVMRIQMLGSYKYQVRLLLPISL